MIDIKELNNGIRLINEYMPDSHIFSIRFCAMVGSKNERENEYGIAHLLEHMTFKSTAKQTTKQISETLDKLGGHFNAYTAQENTVFYVTTTTENAHETIECLCDIFCNTTFDKKELASEKKVVCSEIKMYEDDYPIVCMENLIENLYDKPLGHNVAGSVDSVMNITPEMLADFKIRNYTSGRVIVSTAGGIKTEEIAEYLEKYLEKFSKAEKFSTYDLPEFQPTPKQRDVFQKKDTDQVYCYMSFKGCNKSNKITLTEAILNTLLGGCMSSRLFVGVREEKGLVYHIASFPDRFSTSGCNMIRFFSNKENAEKALIAIREVLDTIKKDGFNEEELKKAKAITKASVILDREKVSHITSINLAKYLYRQEKFDLDKELEKINAITLDQVNERVKEILDFDKMSFSIVAKENTIQPSKFFE